MNKAELIDAMAVESGLTKAETKRALGAFTSVISKALSEGDKVGLVGFGTFLVTERGARLGRNPKTGEEMNIPAKMVVKFKAGSDLALTVNSNSK